MDCVCDYDPAEFYSATMQKARKVHSCEECGKDRIQVGEIYERAVGKWEGDVTTFKTCCRCIALREFVKAHVPCFCWAHGNIIDDAIQTAAHYADETDGLLFGAYRRQVLIRRGPSPR